MSVEVEERMSNARSQTRPLNIGRVDVDLRIVEAQEAPRVRLRAGGQTRHSDLAAAKGAGREAVLREPNARESPQIAIFGRRADVGPEVIAGAPIRGVTRVDIPVQTIGVLVWNIVGRVAAVVIFHPHHAAQLKAGVRARNIEEA